MASKISRNLALEFIVFSPYNNGVMSTHSDHPSQNSVHDLRGLSVGEILRRTRLHYGRSLEDVESVLRIRTSLLEALEADDSSKLPGRVYAIGFIRSYAEYLGLDGDQIVALYKQQLGQGALRPEYNFPVAADESKRPGFSIFIVCVLGLLIVGGCYHFFKADDNDLSDVSYQAEIMQSTTAEGSEAETAQMATLQDNAEPLANADVAANGVQDSVWPPKVEDVMPEMISTLKLADADSLKVDNAQDITTAHEAEGAAPALEGNTESEPTVAGEKEAEVDTSEDVISAGNNAIRIVAKDPTWMQIKDTEGSVVFTGILKEGHDIKVPAEAMGWRMDTGNAGGLDIYIGDDIIPPLGGNGIVVRRIPLFADALRDYGR